MKNIVIKGVLVLLTMIMVQTDMLGQTGKYGDTPEDSIRCLRNLSLYSSQHRQENFEEALPYWRLLYNEFPQSSKNIYIWGADLLSYFIENADTKEEKQAYLDTAMIMFDQRIEYFGDEANVLGRKGLFYFSHNNNIEEAGPGYEALGKAIELSVNDPSPAVITTYMTVTSAMFRAGLVESDEVIKTYTYLMDIIENSLEKRKQKGVIQAKEYVESIFADSGAADCDALTDIFADEVKDSPEDTELLNKVYDLLTNAGCTDNELYLDITEKLHILDPSPKSALTLSSMYRELNEYDQVIKFLQEAIDLQEDTEERANYLLELSLITDDIQKDPQLSREYAMQAIQNNPALGRAHLHIGSLYASVTNCFDGDESADFKNRTVYWAAVDRFNKAKEVDPSLTSQANRLIETYSNYFPDNETIFFHGYTEGDSYEVGCWINEVTRVRPR